MDRSQILDQVADIIRDVLDIHGLHDSRSLRINADTAADQTEGWDSFNHINIVVAIEQHFGVKLSKPLTPHFGCPLEGRIFRGKREECVAPESGISSLASISV